MKFKDDKKEVQRVGIAFVDNSNSCAKGKESEKKMQEIVDYHMSTYKATGGKIQQEKTMMFNLKQKKKTIVEVMINVIVNGVNVNYINVFNSVKTLGVCISPSLSWNDAFELVKLNLKRSIKKLTGADMKLHQVYVCFNMRM